MIELPTCRWRREQTMKGHHRCRSPKLMHGPNGVKDELCSTCYLCNHPRPGLREQLRLWLVRWKAGGLSAFNPRIGRWLRFAQAITRHVLAGLPRATAADVAARRAKCDPCCWRDKRNDSCTQCGCRLGGEKDLLKKLAWAGERCPLYDPAKRPGQYWGPVKGETILRRWWRRLTTCL